MGASDLRLEQAPPFTVPLRFFLTAPWFALLATVLLAWHGPEALTSRWSPVALALTHLFTLGFLAMTMVGALLQLLPVLAGAPMARPQLIGGMVHGLLTLGTLTLSTGFAAAYSPLLHAALWLLGGGFTLFLAAAAWSLRRAERANPAVRPLRLAMIALLVTISLGIFVGLSRAAPIADAHWTDVHLAWGFIGWVGLLVMGVAFHVVPMFQLTPAYPAWMTRRLAPLLFAALLLWSLGQWLAPTYSVFGVITDAITLVIAAGLAAFAVVTLRLQSQRRRQLPDVTLRFWQLAMASLLAGVVMGLALRFAPGNFPRLELLLGTWLIAGFASSAIHGMLYKIVPFLTWLHLHQQNVPGTLPNMKQIMPDSRTRPHLWIHGAALALVTVAVLQPGFWVYPAAAALGLSYAWLAANLWSAFILYRRRTASATDVA